MMLHRGHSLLAAVSTLLSAATADCDRTALLQFADSYVAAQESGSASSLTLAADFAYVENNQTQDLGAGILAKALTIEHRRTIVDAVDCATFTELVVTHDASGAEAPYVTGTQIRHSPDAEDLGVYLIDSIVSTTGNWLFNATQTLYWVRQETWDPIPEEARDSRELLKNAADAYLSMWDNATAADAVPWGTPCARLEGSVYTGNGGPNDSCKLGIPTNHNQAPNSNRRYVIDESMGVVSVLCVFEHLGDAPDSHEFRLENGKTRYIHTMTLAPSDYPIPPVAVSADAADSEVPRRMIRGTNPVFG